MTMLRLTAKMAAENSGEEAEVRQPKLTMLMVEVVAVAEMA